MSKGSGPRPYSVSLDQFASNWDAIFNKDKSVQVKEKEIGRCGCGRSPIGKCIGWHGLTEDAYKEALEKYKEENGENNK